MKHSLKRTLLAVFMLALIGTPFLVGCDDDDNNPEAQVLGTGKDYMALPQQDTLWVFEVQAQRDVYTSDQSVTPDQTDPIQGTAYAQIGGTAPVTILSIMNGISGFPVYAGFDAGSGIDWANNGQPIGYVEPGTDGSIIGKSDDPSDPTVTILPKELKEGQGWTVSSTPFENATYTVKAVELLSTYTNAADSTFTNVIKINVAVNFAKEKTWTEGTQPASIAQKGDHIQIIPSAVEYKASEQATVNINLYLGKNVGPAGAEIVTFQSIYTLTKTDKFDDGSQTSTVIDYHREVVTGNASRVFPPVN